MNHHLRVLKRRLIRQGYDLVLVDPENIIFNVLALNLKNKNFLQVLCIKVIKVPTLNIIVGDYLTDYFNEFVQSFKGYTNLNFWILIYDMNDKEYQFILDKMKGLWVENN